MANPTTLLIGKEDFPPYFELSVYERDLNLDPSILAAQVASVKPILDNSTVSGGSLYEDLQDYIEANKTPTNADYDTLLTYITPFLVLKSLLKHLPFVNVMATNTGFRIVKQGNTDPADQKTVAAMAAEMNARSVSYEKELRDFLCLNASTYSWDVDKVSKFNATLKIGKIGYKYVERK